MPQILPSLRKALLGFGAMLVLLPASAAAAPLGVYAGSGDTAAVAKFADSLGSGRITYAHDYLPGGTWAEISDPGWLINRWATTPYSNGRVIYSVPMLPTTGGYTLAAGATGAYNSYFQTLAQRFVAGGQGNVTLRLGWAMNGNWFPWTIDKPSGGANYAAFWRQIVNTMRAVPGANFKFDWTVHTGSSWTAAGGRLDAATAWPGGAYVDYIGADVYDQSWVSGYTDPVARWNGYLTDVNGLNWHKTFAAQQGKPRTFPEWGIATRPDGHGGGDASYFVAKMNEWTTAPGANVAYSLYSQAGDSSSDHKLFTGSTPKSDARMRALFASPLGVYAGSKGPGAPGGLTQFNTSIGGPGVTYVHEFLDQNLWSDITNPDWVIDHWTSTPYVNGRIIYSIPMMPRTGGYTLAAGATGAYNTYFQTLAQRLVARGQGNAILRVGWEFNGCWMPWTIADLEGKATGCGSDNDPNTNYGGPNGGPNYAAFWRQIVNTMRAVPGAKFQFDWTVNTGSSWTTTGARLNAESAWPGAAYVDYIGTDTYDASWVTGYATDPAARWNGYLTDYNGLNWQKTFAAAQGKPRTFPEFGVAFRGDGHGGGDAPYFIDQMYAWTKPSVANNVAYAMYFQFSDGSTDSTLFIPGRTPLSDARFRADFGH